jgi:hypothetical protein
MYMTRYPVTYLLALLAMALSTFPIRQGAPNERIAIPPQAQQSAVRQTLSAAYKAKLEDATDQGRLALATELREKARGFDKDPTGRYVYLDAARRIFLEANDLDSALEVIVDLEHDFRVDGVGLRVETVSKTANDPGADHADAVAGRTLELVEEFVSAGDLKTAERVLKAGAPLYAMLSEPGLRARWDSRDWYVRERQKADVARETLTSKHDDARSLGTLGRYLCLVESDFAQGLPMLVRARTTADRTLRGLAEADLAGPTEPEEQLKLGDRWLVFAKPLVPMERNGARLRAVYWFEKVLPAFSGTAKGDLVSARLEDAHALETVPPIEAPEKPSSPSEPKATKPAKQTLVKRVSLDIGRNQRAVIVYYAMGSKGKEVEHARADISIPDKLADRRYADFWRERVKTNLPAACKFDRRVTINVTRPWHPADHGQGTENRCSWSCQLEGQGAGKLDKVCTTGDTR